MHVQGLRRAEPGLVPDAGHQLVPGQDLARASGQHGQQVELLRSQGQLLRAEVGPPSQQIQPQPADLDAGPLLRAGPAAQVRPEPRHQLGEPERLGQVVISARVQRDHHVELAGPGGQHHDDPVRHHGPQAAAQHHPVDVRQAQVQEHQVRRFRRGGRQRLGTTRGQPGAVAMAGQRLDELTADILVVLDQQDPRPVHRPDARRRFMRHSLPVPHGTAFTRTQAGRTSRGRKSDGTGSGARCCSDARRPRAGCFVQHLWRDYPILINR